MPGGHFLTRVGWNQKMDKLYQVQSANPNLIPPDINVYEEYGISTSFRRGAMTNVKSRSL
jgi:hypothetical protein